MATRAPAIGITSSYPGDAAGDVDRRVRPYVQAVRRFGGEPVLLPNDVAGLEARLRALDGVVLSGGVDVDPRRYGGRLRHANAETRDYDAPRDAFEAALARAARERAMPLLGICRGLQVANVAFGGTLIEDVREEYGERYAIDHRQVVETGLERTDHAPGHEVVIEAGSRLAALLGAASVPANSMHHQAIRALGEGLRVVGRTADGTIEAVEATFAHPFFFAVQWHPEELADDPATAALFEGLIGAAARRVSPPARSGGSASR